MASDAQIAANSPSPNCGQALSPALSRRREAKRSGITGQVTAMSDGDRPAFERLTNELIRDLAPRTVMELRLAQSQTVPSYEPLRTAHNRSLHKNLATLQAMQAERKRDNERERDNEVLLVRFHEIKSLRYQVAAAPATNGLVFSNDQIIAAALRQRSFEEAEQAVRTRAKIRADSSRRRVTFRHLSATHGPLRDCVGCARARVRCVRII